MSSVLLAPETKPAPPTLATTAAVVKSNTRTLGTTHSDSCATAHDGTCSDNTKKKYTPNYLSSYLSTASALCAPDTDTTDCGGLLKDSPCQVGQCCCTTRTKQYDSATKKSFKTDIVWLTKGSKGCSSTNRCKDEKSVCRSSTGSNICSIREIAQDWDTPKVVTCDNKYGSSSNFKYEMKCDGKRKTGTITCDDAKCKSKFFFNSNKNNLHVLIHKNCNLTHTRHTRWLFFSIS